MTFYMSYDICLLILTYLFLFYGVLIAVSYNFNTLHKKAHEVNVINDTESFDEPEPKSEVEPEDTLLDSFEHNENIETKEDDDDDSMKYIKSDITTTELLNRCKNVEDGVLCQGMYAPIKEFENNALERQLSRY